MNHDRKPAGAGGLRPQFPDPRENRRARRKPEIPEIESLLGQLLQLNGAVLIGAVSPQQANLIQKNLKTVLDVQLKQAQPGGGGPASESLLELCRKNPSALQAVEAFLSDEQIQQLMDEITDAPDDTL